MELKWACTKRLPLRPAPQLHRTLHTAHEHRHSQPRTTALPPLVIGPTSWAVPPASSFPEPTPRARHCVRLLLRGASLSPPSHFPATHTRTQSRPSRCAARCMPVCPTLLGSAGVASPPRFGGHGGGRSERATEKGGRELERAKGASRCVGVLRCVRDGVVVLRCAWERSEYVTNYEPIILSSPQRGSFTSSEFICAAFATFGRE